MFLPASGRVRMSVILAGILVLSIVLVKNRALSILHSDEQESAEYGRSPGCFPTSDSSDVDNTLPPCTQSPRVVTARWESENKLSTHRGNPRQMDNYLTLRDDAGHAETVTVLSENLWNEVNVGNTVTATVWRGQVRRLAANGDSSIILHYDRWAESKVFLIGWSVTGFVCIMTLSAIWGRRGRYRAR